MLKKLIFTAVVTATFAAISVPDIALAAGGLELPAEVLDGWLGLYINNRNNILIVALFIAVVGYFIKGMSLNRSITIALSGVVLAVIPDILYRICPSC